MRLRILGCGAASGVPQVGGNWGACDPAEPRNRRTRTSAIVETDSTAILIDTGPDLRHQLLAAGVTRLDAVMWTHAHADHCHGVDDLRGLYRRMGHAVRGLARPATLDDLATRFDYVFAGKGGYPAIASLEPLPDRITIGDIDVSVVDQPHGSITSAGLRFDAHGKSIIYSTDFNMLTDDMESLFQDGDLWAVDTLRRDPHPTHPHLAQVLEWRARLNIAQTVLIHLDIGMDYATLAAELPSVVRPAYDGLVVTP